MLFVIQEALNMFFEHLLRNLTGQVNKLNGTIDWDRVETILLAHYTARPVRLPLLASYIGDQLLFPMI